MALELSSITEKHLGSLIDSGIEDNNKIINNLYSKIPPQNLQRVQQEENSGIPVALETKRAQRNIKPMSVQEKKQLCLNIKKLNPKFLKGVLEIVKRCTDVDGSEFQFDIDKLPPYICRELERYVRLSLRNPNRSQFSKKQKREELKEAQRIAQERSKAFQLKQDDRIFYEQPDPVEIVFSGSESSSSSDSDAENDFMQTQGVALIPPYKEDIELLPRANLL